MFIRLLILLCFSVAINAQQNKINFEINSSSFPENWGFQVELRLKYQAIDGKKVLAEGRKTTTEKDYLLEQISTEKHNWNITYAEIGNVKIEGSSRSVFFNFSKPIAELRNAICLIRLEGKYTVTLDGKVIGTTPFVQFDNFKSGATYGLQFTYANKNGKNTFETSLVVKENPQKESENKPVDNIVQPNSKITTKKQRGV